MATCAELKIRLGEAEAAWHTLNTTGAVVQIRYGEKLVQYSEKRDLARYLDTLRGDVAAACGECRTRRRAIRLTPC